MKTLVVILALTAQTGCVFAAKRTPVPAVQDQAEYNRLMRECDRIAEYFSSMGAQQSSAFHNAIFQHLKDVGTPAAFRALQAQVSAGRVPTSYLQQF